MEEIGSAKSSFYIQYGQIVSIISEEPHYLSGMKVTGSNLSRFLEIGTYLSGTEKQFWYIKKRKYHFLILVLKSNFYHTKQNGFSFFQIENKLKFFDNMF